MASTKPIETFKDYYEYLSMNYPAEFVYKGIMYNNIKSAYWAEHCANQSDKYRLSRTSAKNAKHVFGRINDNDTIIMTDTEEIGLMCDITLAKFEQNPELAKKLTKTGKRKITFVNHWGDKFWGVYNGVGEDNFGRILTIVRGLMNISIKRGWI